MSTTVYWHERTYMEQVVGRCCCSACCCWKKGKWKNKVKLKLQTMWRRRTMPSNSFNSIVLSYINIDWGKFLFCECIGNSVKYSFIKLWNDGKLQIDDIYIQKRQKCGWTMRDCCTRGTLHLVDGLYLFNSSIFSAQVLYQKATWDFLSQKTQMSDFSLNLMQVIFCSDQVRFKQ